MSKAVAEAKAALERAYEVSGLLILKDLLEIVSKYQEPEEATGMLREYGVEEAQNDALRLTALCYTVHSTMVEYEAQQLKAKAVVKFEKAKSYNALKSADPKLSDKRCENHAEEAVWEHVEDEIRKRKVVSYLDVAWQRAVDVVNMLKKYVERAMWQGPQPS